jgi:nitrite reductase (cytochrome c-552)
VGTLIVTFVLVTMFEHKQDARSPYLRIVELDEISTDPAPWAKNWPHHLRAVQATAGDEFYGGSSALPESKLDSSPWLKRLYAGYAFSIDYREARGHAYMLYDQVVTERVNQRRRPAPACTATPRPRCSTARRASRRWACPPTTSARRRVQHAGGDPRLRGAQPQALPRGARDAHQRCPTARPASTSRSRRSPSRRAGGFGEFDARRAGARAGHFAMSEAHPVSCIDCHDPETMQIRITRPGFMLGIAALAESDAPVPHMPSIERWRAASRERAVRPQQAGHAPGDALLRLRPVPRRVLLRQQGHAEFPWGTA